jgi:hypothetical protein|tara:strand:+ start:199 stop:621 length:423 start_codon:yes stop_codon:yes gene_type:complete
MPSTTSIEHESYQDIMARWRVDQDKRQNKAINKLKELAPEYIKKGYKLIHVSYSGCGDSGEVTEVYTTIDDKTHYFNYKDNEYEEISDIVYDLLTYDWYNNDGGGGTVDINLESGEVEIDAYYVVEEHAKSEEQKPYLTF